MVAFNVAGVIILGWIAGLTINYLADVLPFTRHFSYPKCHSCSAPWPIKAYLMLSTCPSCGTRREIRALIVQILAVAISVGIWFFPSPRLGFLPGLFLLTYFGIIVVIDIEHHLILHPVSIFGAVLGAGIGIWLHGWIPTLVGGLVGFLIMLVLYWFGGLFARLLAKLRKQEIDEVALGFGDVNLSGVLGLILGWPGITAGLFGAILLGGVGSLLVMFSMLATKRYQAFVAIPYAPFLILSATFLLFQ